MTAAIPRADNDCLDINLSQELSILTIERRFQRDDYLPTLHIQDICQLCLGTFKMQFC